VSLRHPLLAERGVVHGFGLRDVPVPPGVLLPRQVHGARVVAAEACRAEPAPEADAVTSREPGVAVGVVTADCVPILLAAETGAAVAAVHAGWRGLVAGVVPQSVDALRRSARVSGGARIVAAIGPHIGPCCYEVDAPVLEPLTGVFGAALERARRAGRPGHAHVDLGALAAEALVRSGLHVDDIGRLPECCTRCDAVRFHSFRRDGPRAGRLMHHVAPAET